MARLISEDLRVYETRDHDGACLCAFADVRQERTAIERGQPERAESETEEQEQRRARAETKTRLPAKHDRSGQPQAQRRDETVLERQ
jgi:hypothetical protein